MKISYVIFLFYSENTFTRCHTQRAYSDLNKSYCKLQNGNYEGNFANKSVSGVPANELSEAKLFDGQSNAWNLMVSSMGKNNDQGAKTYAAALAARPVGGQDQRLPEQKEVNGKSYFQF